jgi:hypothetical protein
MDEHVNLRLNQILVRILLAVLNVVYVNRIVMNFKDDTVAFKKSLQCNACLIAVCGVSCE